MQKNFLHNESSYFITEVIGLKSDIDNIYFVKHNAQPKAGKVLFKYDESLKQISIVSDTTLLAYYTLERTNTNMLINNYSPLRNKLSFNDLRERKYQLIIEKEEGNEVVLRIENAGVTNKLSRPVIFKLKQKE